RRWRAAKRAGITEVPVIVKKASDTEVLELSLIENIQREDLSCLEEAEAYKQLTKEFTLTQEEVAKR
ncbi:MAG: chromosome partitioning protein ParB, partial [Deltaproteobacteria bacterium CG_4_10_14_0_8_um_filter_43_12]